MQVILIKDVDNLGAAHELVEVKPGYARNFLIPQKYAIEASGSNRKILEERRKQLEKREQKLLAEIAKVRQVLSESPVKVGAKVGVSGKIFGSVTAIQIARAIREQKGYEIDRRRTCGPVPHRVRRPRRGRNLAGRTRRRGCVRSTRRNHRRGTA